MATSTQDLVRPGECLDLYYYDGETSMKQCFGTTQNTRFISQFQNLGAGSSVFTIPPQNGIQDVVLTFVLPDTGAGGSGDGLALPRGWGYALIKQVSFRYGGSSTYFLTGDQILQNALRKQPNQSAAAQLLALGGDALSEAELEVAGNTANVVLTLPHNSVSSGVGKPHPFPSDLLTQQIQVTVEILRPADIVSNNGGTIPAAYNALAQAQFQVQQVMLNNQGDALARRVDMSTNAYAFPTEFVQQVQRVNVPLSTTSPQELVLTGFRSGEVKAIHCWLADTADQTGNTKMPFRWQLPSAIQLTYAGEIFSRFDAKSSALWNLINGNKIPAVDNVDFAWNAGTGVYDYTPSLAYWVELPFAQTLVDEDSHSILVHGKPITNGICNLTITTPYAASTWVLSVSYIYNSTLLMSQGTCDYVF